MKTIILLSAIMTSCASTKLYKDGKVIAHFESNLENVEYSGNGVTFKATKMDNSTPTLAQGEAAQGKIEAAGIALATSGALNLLK